MRSFPRNWGRALFLVGTALLAGCDLSPEQGDRVIGPSFLLTTTPGIGFWTAKGPMTTARYYLGVALTGGMLYAVGGYDNNNTSGPGLATVEAYHPVTDAWTTKTSMPTPRWGVATAVVNGGIYAVGGQASPSGQYLTTVEAYDPVNDVWTTKSSMPTARGLLGVVTVNGILYAVGGQNGAYLATVEAYDPVADAWTTKTSMPTARSLLGVSTVNGILYAVGGVSNAGYLATVEAYDPATDTWTTKASMPTARYGVGTGAVNGLLYAVGGGNGNPVTVLGTVEAYDPATDTWAAKASMPTARFSLGLAGINGILYAVGGGNTNGGALATVEALTPPYLFTGFFQPVDNAPVVNTLKAGSAVPVKFSLHGYQGVDIFATSSPSSQGYTCNGSSEDAIEQTVTAGSSSLSYDATTDQYTYVWKTDRAWAGTCRQFQLGLKDGSVQVALFHFTK